MKIHSFINSADFSKTLNLSTVYKLIAQTKNISRIQIAEQSGLAPASITKITRQLLEHGLIKEIALQASTGGRRATSLEIEQKKITLLALHLEASQLSLGCVNLEGTVLHKKHCPLDSVQNVTKLEQQILCAVDEFLSSLNSQQNMIAIGLVVNGGVGLESNHIESLPFMPLTQPWELGRQLQQQTGLPTYLGHDVRSLALAEHYLGATQDCDDSLLLHIGEEVGAGIVINHEVFSGRKNAVGELGHIQVEPLGNRCLCGNIGCLQTVASNVAIEQKMQHILEQGYNSRWLSLTQYDIDSICAAGNHHDELAMQLIEQVGLQIGRVLAMSVNMFNPQKIVFSGKLNQVKSVLFPAIYRALESHALPSLVSEVQLVSSQLSSPQFMGAVALIKQALLEGELLVHLLQDQKNTRK